MMDGPVAFGAEISEDRRLCAIAAGWREPAGGHVVAEIVWYDAARRAVGRLYELYLGHDPVCVGLDPKSQSVTLVRPLAELGIIVRRLTAEDVAVAHGEFLDLVNGGSLRHLGQRELTAAVGAAQQRPLAGAQALERRVLVDQAPLVAAEIAVWAFLRWEELAQPGAWQI